MSSSRRPLRSRALDLLLLAGSLVASLGLAELAVRWLDLFSLERAVLEQTATTQLQAPDAPADDGEAQPGVSKYVLHPFLGWSPRPSPPWERNLIGRDAGPRVENWIARNNHKNVLGFHSEVGDYRLLAESDFVIGVLGGSVAQHLALRGGGALLRRLEERLPELTPHTYVLDLAQGGYKQPSQLIVLETMLLLGVPFDVVVNLDGFNEVALGGTDAQEGRHPLFPYREQLALAYDWNAGNPSPAALEQTVLVLQLRRRAAELRATAEAGGWGRSQLWRVLAGLQVRRLEVRAVEVEGELQAQAAQDVTGIFELYDPCLGQVGACLDVIGEIWQRGSLAIDALARRFGLVYVHALQPNQYPEGAKPLTDEERACCYRPGGRWARDAVAGYPRLRQRGLELREQGVDFHDLSELFAQRRETLYSDACCHLNQDGNVLLGEAIADLVAEALEKSGRTGAGEVSR